jgi:hypothetical protein
MVKGKTVFIPLTGGLGNQLFQYAAALSRDADAIILDTKLGKPRLGKSLDPVLEDFVLANTSRHIPSRRLNIFFGKTWGYILRSGMSPSLLESSKIVRRIITLTGNAVLNTYFRTWIKLIQATDNGYFIIAPTKRKELLIGYFQSYIWANLPSAKMELKSLRLKSNPKSLTDFLDQYQNQRILSVHIRRGDYRNETSFGLLSSNYYERAIALVSEEYDFDRIWLFSDEPNFAISLLPKNLIGRVEIVPDFDGSASATLEAMRHANAYVLANSSLSWWGAWLSYIEDPIVIAPEPWFRHSPEPKKIIPSNWQRISAWEPKDI